MWREYDQDRDELTVWGSFQDPHRPREQLAHILQRDPERTRVIVPDVGGAFGSKGVIAPEVAAVAAAAMLCRRPLKWTEDRLENLSPAIRAAGSRATSNWRSTPTAGCLPCAPGCGPTSARICSRPRRSPLHTAATLICGVYDIAVADIEMTGMRTDKVPTGPYRGAGRPDAAYMIEALVEKAARETAIDAVTLRRRNLIRQFPYSTATGLEYDSGDYERCLDLALEMAGEPPVRDADGPIPGRGLGMYVERAGGAWESATIAVTPTGTFTVATSASPHGQGHETTFAQIAADRLCVDPAAITVVHGDSDGAPGVGTFGSRSTAQAGSAVWLAAEQLIETARARAAEQLTLPPSAVSLDAEGFHGPGAGPLSWAELALPARDAEPLQAQARFASANVFSSGAYVADVVIDPDTGATAVTQLIAVDDAGTLINPLLAHGQVIGGAVQGLGECLTEEVLFDDAGQNRSGSLLDYSLLTAAEIPPIRTGEVQTPSPLNPLGAKGAGEGGAVGTLPAVANAVADAVGRHLDPPFTADRVWRALAAIAVERDAPTSPPPPVPAPPPVAPLTPVSPPSPISAHSSPFPRAWLGPLVAVLAGAAAAVALRRIGRRR